MSIRLDDRYAQNFAQPGELAAMAAEVQAAQEKLHSATGAGSDFLGWLTLPTDYDKEEFGRIQAAAKRIRENSDVLIVIGIGGSYLGARAVLEFIKSPHYNLLAKDTPQIYFTGNSISSTALSELLALCEGKDVSVNVISKSGTTTEPAHFVGSASCWRKNTARRLPQSASMPRPTARAARSRNLPTRPAMKPLLCRMMWAVAILCSRLWDYCRLRSAARISKRLWQARRMPKKL